MRAFRTNNWKVRDSKRWVKNYSYFISRRFNQIRISYADSIISLIFVNKCEGGLINTKIMYHYKQNHYL